METKNIEQIWKSGKDTIGRRQEPEMETVRKLTRKSFDLNKTVMFVYLALYLLLLAGTIIFSILNLSGYQNNAGMLAVQAGVLIVAIAFSSYGIMLVRKVIRMDRFTDDLITALKKRIGFYRVHYEIWLCMAALTIVLLPFSINTMVDNVNGTYRINNITLFVLIQTGVFVINYLMLKLVHFPIISRLRAHLEDLEKQSAESTTLYENRRRKWKWWVIAGWAVVAGLLLWAVIEGIVLYL